MSDPISTGSAGDIEPAVTAEGRRRGWSDWLVIFLRIMAAVSMFKGLYHWSVVCGFDGHDDGFDAHAVPWQTATVFFAVIDLVAAVGLWLAAPWGAVVWLTASISMIAVQIFFPQIYGGGIPELVIGEGVLIVIYLFLAIRAAREAPR
jgi:Family of unknown function (DUF6163)